jgi:asparagine synthase (glutamine-hydrolysing)
VCGIAGLVDFGNRPADELARALSRMQTALRHRGPDGAGLAFLHGASVQEGSDVLAPTRGRPGSGPAVGLAHLRLAIIDLSPGGHQPMQSANQSDWLTYNGELYNYRELRRRLIDRGVSLRSTSDSEVLLEGLSADGISTLSQIRGMFAFAWWSEADRRLLLARDRFGIKPLLVARPFPDLVLFASEARAIAASGYINLEPDADAIAAVLARGSVPVGQTFWKCIDAVPPGAWMSFGESEVSAGQYWSLDNALLRTTEKRSAAQVAQAVRPALVESVEAHLVSDVPVGIFLSGGLDSAALLAAAREVTSGPLQTFTVTMPGSPLDEAQHARAVAHRFGSEHTELSLDDLDVDAALVEFFAVMQSPTLDGFNTFLVAKAARQAGARVVLSGVGADELFGGYGSFDYVPRLHRMRSRYGPMARLASRLLRSLAPGFAAKLSRAFAADTRSVAETWWRSRQLFTDDEIGRLSGQSAPSMPALPASAEFDQVRYCEFRFFLESQLLGDADAFTMCRALELRTPFVDHVLLEAVVDAGRWPVDRGRSHKATLFGHLSGLCTPDAAGRRKQGFVLPFEAWIREGLTQPEPRQLADIAQKLIDPQFRPFVERFQARQLHWSRLWTLYVLERLGHSLGGAPTFPRQSIAS